MEHSLDNAWILGCSALVLLMQGGFTWLETGLVLSWRERGGPPCAPRKDGGIGLKLVRGLIEYEVGGKVVFEFGEQGLGVEIVLPTENGAPRPLLLV